MNSEQELFINDTAARFSNGLRSMMETTASDTFAFDFPIASIPALQTAAKALGLADDTLTLMVLIRPASQAEPFLDFLNKARNGEIVITGDETAAAAPEVAKG